MLISTKRASSFSSLRLLLPLLFPMVDSLPKITDFKPHVSSYFALFCDDGAEPLQVELVSVDELPYARPDELGKAFSLIFRNSSAQILPQKIYRFEHEVMGQLSLFIVPIGPDEKGMRYEAIFN